MASRQRTGGTPAGSRRTSTLLGIVAAAALGVLFFSAFTVISATGSGGAGTQRIAYFADWNTANRGYRIKDVADSGTAARLTRLMWAFGDVGANGRCRIAEDSDQPWEIYQRRYEAAESVDGEADTYDQSLAGSLNQLRKLREEYPELRTSISLGNWNWSRHFSDAARTEESRSAFVSSCVDLWLKGDLPRYKGEPQGGPGSAAGVFDGIDLDWEWPGGGGKEGNVERPEDKRNFTLLVQEFRRQLDALEAETGHEYALSASLSHNEEQMRRGYEPEAFASLDFATVQGYDFTGSYSPTTGHHSQLYAPGGPGGGEDRGGGANSGPADGATGAGGGGESGDTGGGVGADSAVRMYLDYGLPAEKLVLGFPGFGRGWKGVPPQDFGRRAPAGSFADGDYGEGTDSYADLEKREGQRFFDPVAGSFWIYDGDEWWTYDTPEVVALKGRYAREHGLGGLMLWNLDMDPGGELVRAMDESLDGG